MNTVRYHHGGESYPQGKDTRSLMNRNTHRGAEAAPPGGCAPLGGTQTCWRMGQHKCHRAQQSWDGFAQRQQSSGRPYLCAQRMKPNSSQMRTVNGQETVGTHQTTATLPNYQKHMAASSLSPFDTLWNLPNNSGGWCSTQVYSRSLDNCICAPHTHKKKSFSKYIKNNENKQSYYPNKSKCIST